MLKALQVMGEGTNKRPMSFNIVLVLGIISEQNTAHPRHHPCLEFYHIEF